MRLATGIALGGLRAQGRGRIIYQQWAAYRPSWRRLSEFEAKPSLEMAEKSMINTILNGSVDEFVCLLKTTEFSPNHRFADLRHCTPLMLAAEYNKVPIVTALLENGADPNLQDDFGDTAANIAAREKSRESLHALIASGAQLDILNYEGMTAVDCTLDPTMDKEMRQRKGEDGADGIKDI